MSKRPLTSQLRLVRLPSRRVLIHSKGVLRFIAVQIYQHGDWQGLFLCQQHVKASKLLTVVEHESSASPM